MAEEKLTTIEDLDPIEDEEIELPPITYNDSIYFLRCTDKKVEQIEDSTGKSIFILLSEGHGFFPISLMRRVFQLCLYDTRSKQVDPEKANNVFQAYLKENGIVMTSALIQKMFDRDVPFLFRLT